MSSQIRKYELKARAEKQAETRRRIVEATLGLHQEVGPARTTVAEIALEGAAASVPARLRLASRVGGAAVTPGEKLSLAWPVDECRLVF